MPSPEPRAPTPPSSSASLAAYRTPSCPAPSSTVFIASGLSTRAMEEVLVTESISAQIGSSLDDALPCICTGRSASDCRCGGRLPEIRTIPDPTWIHGSCPWILLAVYFGWLCIFSIFHILCSPPYGSTYIILYPMSKYVPGLSQLSPNERKDVRGATPTGMVCGRVLGASSWGLSLLVLGSWVCRFLGVPSSFLGS